MSIHYENSPRLPSNPTRALHALSAWKIYCSGDPIFYGPVMIGLMTTIKFHCGKTLHKVPWARRAFERGLLTPLGAVPPMKLKKNGQPRKNEQEKHARNVTNTKLLNFFLDNPLDPLGPECSEVSDIVVGYGGTGDPGDPYEYLQDLPGFSHLYRPVDYRENLHPTFCFFFHTSLKQNITIAVLKWTK